MEQRSLARLAISKFLFKNALVLLGKLAAHGIHTVRDLVQTGLSRDSFSLREVGDAVRLKTACEEEMGTRPSRPTPRHSLRSRSPMLARGRPPPWRLQRSRPPPWRTEKGKGEGIGSPAQSLLRPVNSRSPPRPPKQRLAATDAEAIQIHKLAVKDAAEDEANVKTTASVSQPRVADKYTAPPGLSRGASASAALSHDVRETRVRKARNSRTYGVAKAIVSQMKAWYTERCEDDDVSTTWKHLHRVLFKKARVPYASDIWSKSASVSQPSASQGDEPADGLPMVVSEEFVAMQVKSVIERREQWLTDNNLPLSTIMIGSQKDEFLAEIKAEYHGSADQQQRQANDKANGKSVPAGKKQRWSRECQRRGGTTQMFHLLSFSGRWDPSFFATLPVPQQLGEQAESQKVATRAAAQARSQLRLAQTYDALNKRKNYLAPEQQALLALLHDGTLLAEANRLTKISGHGRLRRRDGTSVDIGGSTGGLTRAVLYNWTPPNLDDDEFP